MTAPPAVLVPASQAGVQDRRGQFRRALGSVMAREHGEQPRWTCEDVLHRLGGEAAPAVPAVPPLGRFRVAIVPGYGADCFSGLVTVLGDARTHLDTLGWRSEEIAIEGLSSSTRNAALIREHVLAVSLDPDERLVLLGYSKGAADMMEALARYPEIRPRIAAAVSLSGTVVGSPLADSPPELLPWLARNMPGSGCTAGDGGAFESLRRSTGLAFLAENPPSGFGVPLFSLGAFAHRERISLVLLPTYDRLAMIDPRNDSQTLFTDQVIPGSFLLGYLNADHWAVGLPLDSAQPVLSALFTDENAFPRPAMLEAVLRVVAETLPMPRP
jgi:hypothetical protein